MPSPDSSVCFLFDNGSLRAESTRSLRKVAAALRERTGREVRAVSLLHSSNVPADLLGGEPARLLEPALLDYFSNNPAGEALLVPLFFGPSAALTDYVPERIKALKTRFPGARIRLASWLVNIAEADRRMAVMLADRVRATLRTKGWVRPNVLLVDHGSPQAAVTAVRNHLGRQLREDLGPEVEELAVASMERREGPAYAFGDPLLAAALRTPPFDHGEVVIVLQFLSPGRHAGPDGDITAICEAAKRQNPRLAIATTELLATDTRLVELLAERLAQANPL